MSALDVRLDWAQDEAEERYDDVASLDARLDALHAGCARDAPLLVTVFAHGRELLLGLGSETSCVQVSEESGDGHCIVTLGDPRAEGATAFFLHGEHHTEIPNRNLVPTAVARQIARELVSAGARPTLTDWEQLF